MTAPDRYSRDDDGTGAHAGFGTRFTRHMVWADWTAGSGWEDLQSAMYGPLMLDPAAAVLHYGQAVFEGLKAFRFGDGSIHLFRPDVHARRLRASARRLCLPEPPEDLFLTSLRRLLELDADAVPEPPASLYLRPFLLGTEAFLGVRAARTARYAVIGSPAFSYFPSGRSAVRIWLSREYSRAGARGTGAAKTGGNYAASLIAQQDAHAHGCDQVLFLDAAEGRYLEELGGMNLVLVRKDGCLITPDSDSILAGVTVDSILALAGRRGYTVERRPVELAEWQEGAADGTIVAAFACGTAAVVAPIELLLGEGVELRHRPHPLSDLPLSLRRELLEIQHGGPGDHHRWMVPADG